MGALPAVGARAELPDRCRAAPRAPAQLQSAPSRKHHHRRGPELVHRPPDLCGISYRGGGGGGGGNSSDAGKTPVGMAATAVVYFKDASQLSFEDSNFHARGQVCFVCVRVRACVYVCLLCCDSYT